MHNNKKTDYTKEDLEAKRDRMIRYCMEQLGNSREEAELIADMVIRAMVDKSED